MGAKVVVAPGQARAGWLDDLGAPTLNSGARARMELVVQMR